MVVVDYKNTIERTSLTIGSRTPSAFRLLAGPSGSVHIYSRKSGPEETWSFLSCKNFYKKKRAKVGRRKRGRFYLVKIIKWAGGNVVVFVL